MTDPNTKWTATAPGILELPTTKLRIEYVVGSSVPFRVRWDGQSIPCGDHSCLESAKEAAEKHMAELITMGFEV